MHNKKQSLFSYVIIGHDQTHISMNLSKFMLLEIFF